MKNNQFGRINRSIDQELTELAQINFTDQNLFDSPKAQLSDFLIHATLAADSPAIYEQKMRNLLATPTTNVFDFFRSDAPLTQDIFYLIALQLLQFEAGSDFELTDPLAAMQKLNLPISELNFDTAKSVAHAWYLLLNTHTKMGETYLDFLAQEGYFLDFYGQSTEPLIFNGKTQPVFDPHQLIREVVYVEAPLDTDQDGKLDLIKAEILRPAATNQGYQAPVLYTSSPYNQGINDSYGEAVTHHVDLPLTAKEPNHATKSDVTFTAATADLPEKRPITGESKTAEQTFAREQPYTLNNYFLARGFAVVYSSGIGTRDSDGIRNTGMVEETISTTAVIEWLAGNRTAFTNKTDNIEIKAWWSNHKIAMTGRSYLGTLATAAATTGVTGLETVISEAAISSWYDYYRDNGLVAAPDTFQGEDMDVLAAEVFSRKQDAGDYLNIKPLFDKIMEQIDQNQDRASGNYSKYWDAANYRNNVDKIKADMILVHGLNDWNVKPRNVGKLWQAIRDLPITKKVILHQGQHIYINAFRSLDFTDMMNLWLSYKLLDVDNHADQVLPNVLIQDNVQPETWNTYQDWQAVDDVTKTYYLQPKSLVEEPSDTHSAASFKDWLDQDIFDDYKANLTKWHRDLLTTQHDTEGINNLKANRLIFKTSQLDHELVIDGAPKVKVNVATNQPFGMLSFQLVDFGKAKRLTETPTILAPHALSGAYDWRTDDLREFTLQTKETPWKMISKGHINLQNRTNSYLVEELKSNQFYDVELELQPTFYRIPKNHQLGLVIYATDFETTIRGNQQLQYSLQLNESTLTIKLAADSTN